MAGLRPRSLWFPSGPLDSHGAFLACCLDLCLCFGAAQETLSCLYYRRNLSFYCPCFLYDLKFFTLYLCLIVGPRHFLLVLSLVGGVCARCF